MQNRHPAGNAAVEYSILFALITMAAMGPLAAAGNSVSSLLNQPIQGTSGQALDRMVNMNFSAASGTLPTMPGLASPTGGASGSMQAAAQTMSASINGNGNNATSTDGSTALANIQATYRMAAMLAAKADQTNNNELADWYRETARYAYRLAGSEATFTYQTNPSANTELQPLLDGNLGKGDAIRSMYEMQKELDKKIAQISQSTTIPETNKQEALTLANQIMNGFSGQYGGLLATYSDQGNLKLSQLLRDFGNGDRQYQRDNLQTEAVSVLSHSSTQQDAGAVQTSLKSGLVMDVKATSGP